MNLGFALEHSLGHTTHAQNLKRVLQERPDITPTYVDLPYEGMTGAWTRLPGVRSNWSIGTFALIPRQHKTVVARCNALANNYIVIDL